MGDVYYLNEKDIIQIHYDVIDIAGGASGIRIYAGIESAVTAPQAVYYDTEIYPTLADKAAIYCFELVTQHPLIDGNKRVGHGAMVNFLFMNGHIIDADDDEQEEIILAVASGQLTKEAFTNWVKEHLSPYND